MKRLDLKVDRRSEVPIYKQIRTSVENSISDARLKMGDQIPSIHNIATTLGISPGTVSRAYDELRELGIISSKQGKGYYISSLDMDKHMRIFLLFDRINAYKEILYDSFRNEFDIRTDIKVFFHHCNIQNFEKLIRENLGRYSHYVLMPHLNESIKKIVTSIPENRTVFLDNLPGDLKTCAGAVYQDFHNDIYNLLELEIDRIRSYNSVNLSLSKSEFQFVPKDSQSGFIDVCKTYDLNFSIINSITASNLEKNNLYIIFDDTELIETLKIINKRKWKLKEDVGIISRNETPMKELIAGGISVFTTT
jgi:DNA-binding transcriptional regulator YhcF (GntR family)